MIDRIHKDRLDAFCQARDIDLEELSAASGVPVKVLERARKTSFIKSRELKSVCEVLGIKPKELTRRMPLAVGGLSGLDLKSDSKTPDNK